MSIVFGQIIFVMSFDDNHILEKYHFTNNISSFMNNTNDHLQDVHMSRDHLHSFLASYNGNV